MHDFLIDIAHESAAEFEAKDQNVAVGGNAFLKADHKVLRSAISNLVRNAVKFTPPGGHIHLRAKQADGRVIVEVEDECGGLPPHKAAELLAPLVQGGRDRCGFGLGVAIAKQAAEAHGGELRVHDLPGKGCVFVLDLPEVGSTRQDTDDLSSRQKIQPLLRIQDELCCCATPIAGTPAGLTQFDAQRLVILATTVALLLSRATAVARGDLSRKITVDVKGEILQLAG